MRKIMSRVTIFAVCALMLFGLAGCGQSKYILPKIVYAGDGDITIEHVTNVEADYILYEDDEYPDDTHLLRHDDFVQWGSVQWAWVIKSEGDVVGWIQTQGGVGSSSNDARDDYSYGISYNGNKFADETCPITVYFIADDITDEYIREHVTLTSNAGNISYSECVNIDGTPFILACYTLDLSGIKAKDATDMTFTFGIHK